LRTEETAAAGDKDLHTRNGERNCLRPALAVSSST
jgi:hypothetical protein